MAPLALTETEPGWGKQELAPSRLAAEKSDFQMPKEIQPLGDKQPLGSPATVLICSSSVNSRMVWKSFRGVSLSPTRTTGVMPYGMTWGLFPLGKQTEVFLLSVFLLASTSGVVPSLFCLVVYLWAKLKLCVPVDAMLGGGGQEQGDLRLQYSPPPLTC